MKNAAHECYNRVRRMVVDDHAIQSAELIDVMSPRRNVTLYHFGVWQTLQSLYLMYIVFGQDAWNSKYKELLGKFEVYDNRLSSPGIYMHVKLMNGKEYLTRDKFDSRALSVFSNPTAKYLCVYIGTLNVSCFFKRMLSSWAALGPLTAMDFVYIAMKLDKRVRNYILGSESGPMQEVMLVDDETFEERKYAMNEVVSI